MNKVVRFLQLGRPDKDLLVRAAALMAIFRLGLWVCRFSRVRGFAMREHRRLSYAGSCSPARIAWAIQVTRRLVPGTTCLVEALTAKVLLDGVGLPATLHIGVAKAGGEPFAAHAWVESLGAGVVGRPDAGRYASMLSIGGE